MIVPRENDTYLVDEAWGNFEEHIECDTLQQAIEVACTDLCYMMPINILSPQL